MPRGAYKRRAMNLLKFPNKAPFRLYAPGLIQINIYVYIYIYIYIYIYNI